MKLVFITPNPFPHSGGQTTHIMMLRKGLNELGHETDIISYYDINKVVRVILIGIPVWILDKIYKGLGALYQYICINLFLNLIYAIRNIKNKYELISLQNSSLYIYLKNKNIPQVLTNHGDLVNELLNGGAIVAGTVIEKLFWQVEKRTYRNCDAVIAVDTRLKEHIEKLSGREDVFIIKNFIDTNEFIPKHVDDLAIRKKMGIEEKTKVLLLTRRLTAKNGVKVPLYALKLLLQKGYNNCLFVYAGDGELRKEMERYVDENGLKKNVLFLGNVVHSEIKSLYSIADIVLIPSVRSYGMVEATSISAIEAMSMGIPVVASAIGGLRELIIDKKTGLLIEENSPQQLAEAVIRLISDERLRQSFSKEAREYIIANHGYISAANKFLDIYRKELDGKQRRS